ncbi:MAG: hypothetical protein ABIP67_14845, partial [Burkholderiales bacterium]
VRLRHEIAQSKATGVAHKTAESIHKTVDGLAATAASGAHQAAAKIASATGPVWGGSNRACAASTFQELKRWKAAINTFRPILSPLSAPLSRWAL